MKKGFTLIELMAVIIILAVIALIITPIVNNSIADSKIGSNARSVEAHIKNIESAITEEAFNSGNNLKMYGGGDISGLTLPAKDKIVCDSYVIENGMVEKATNCANPSWDMSFNYDETKGTSLVK